MDYDDLLNYYKDCFSFVDKFHFNSEVSRSVFMTKNPNANGKIIHITHCGIKEHRKHKRFNGQKLKLGFIGSEAPFKGLPLLIDILKGLGKDSKWVLSVWGGRKAKHPSLPIYYRGKFDMDKIENVYDDMDVLLVPSMWKETFSLVTLEALSYGVPVIVSDNVGAQDIVKEYNDAFVFHSVNELKVLLEELVNDKSKLVDFNKSILDKPWQHDILVHVNEIIENIYRNQ